MIRLLLCGLLWLFSSTAVAHKPSDSYLSIEITERTIQGQWDIALRDLDYAVGLDDNGDRQAYLETTLLGVDARSEDEHAEDHHQPGTHRERKALEYLAHDLGVAGLLDLDALRQVPRRRQRHHLLDQVQGGAAIEIGRANV